MALRILTQINYSAGENAAADSGLRFTGTLLQRLVHADKDLHFYVLVPEKLLPLWLESLPEPQITLIPLDLQPRLHGGDFQFNPDELYRRVDLRKYDIDILFLNQPETASAFLQFFNRQTFHNVPAVSYVHWFDTRRPSTPKQRLHLPALLACLSGMQVSSSVGCNSTYGKEAILKQAQRWFHPGAVKELGSKLKILPPPIDGHRLRPRNAKPSRRNVQIVVNHRLLKYTGVRNLLVKVFPELWTRRKDFRVVFTNPSRVRLPKTITDAKWLRMETLPVDDYVRLLQESDIVIGPHRSTHWSISTLEAICADCVPLMNKESFFPEMFAPILAAVPEATRSHVEQRWFYFRRNMIDKLSSLIDNIEQERRLSRLIGTKARQVYDWDSWTQAWLDVFRDAEREIPAMAGENPSMVKIAELLKQKRRVSKDEILRELKWSPKQRTLCWTSFRKVLRKIGPDDSCNSEVFFELAREKKAPRKRRKLGDSARTVRP